MYRKLIIVALAGAFLLGLAAQSQATRTSGGPAYKTADGFVTSNWPGTKGTNARTLMANMLRNSAPAAAKTKSDDSAAKADRVEEKPKASGEYVFRRFDTRNPKNHVIRPGGVVIKP